VVVVVVVVVVAAVAFGTIVGSVIIQVPEIKLWLDTGHNWR